MWVEHEFFIKTLGQWCHICVVYWTLCIKVFQVQKRILKDFQVQECPDQSNNSID